MAMCARKDTWLFQYEKKITGFLSEESWALYGNFTHTVSLPATRQQPRPSFLKPLADYYRSYRCKHEQGSQNYGKWADAAAKEARRV